MNRIDRIIYGNYIPTGTASPTPQPTAATPNYYPYTPHSATAAQDETATGSRFPDKARFFREHNAIAWIGCQVIENGVLPASGAVKDNRALLNNPAVATFVIKCRNSYRNPLIILSRVLSGLS